MAGTLSHLTYAVVDVPRNNVNIQETQIMIIIAELWLQKSSAKEWK